MPYADEKLIPDKYLITEIIHVADYKYSKYTFNDDYMSYEFTICVRSKDAEGNEYILIMKLCRHGDNIMKRSHFAFGKIYKVSYFEKYDFGIHVNYFDDQYEYNSFFVKRASCFENMCCYTLKFTDSDVEMLSYIDKYAYSTSRNEFGKIIKNGEKIREKTKSWLQNVIWDTQYDANYNLFAESAIHFVHKKFGNEILFDIYSQHKLISVFLPKEIDLVANVINIFAENGHKCDSTCLSLLVMSSMVYEHSLLLFRESR